MTIQHVMRRVLAYGGLLVLVVALGGGIVGALLAGWSGIVSALVACAATIGCVALTAAILGLVLGRGRLGSTRLLIAAIAAMLAKAALFAVLLVTTREQPWLEPQVLVWLLLAGVIGALLVDVLVLVVTRRPELDETPEEETLGRPAKR